MHELSSGLPATKFSISSPIKKAHPVSLSENASLVPQENGNGAGYSLLPMLKSVLQYFTTLWLNSKVSSGCPHDPKVWRYNWEFLWQPPTPTAWPRPSPALLPCIPQVSPSAQNRVRMSRGSPLSIQKQSGMWSSWLLHSLCLRVRRGSLPGVAFPTQRGGPPVHQGGRSSPGCGWCGNHACQQWGLGLPLSHRTEKISQALWRGHWAGQSKPILLVPHALTVRCVTEGNTPPRTCYCLLGSMPATGVPVLA